MKKRRQKREVVKIVETELAGIRQDSTFVITRDSLKMMGFPEFQFESKRR